MLNIIEKYGKGGSSRGDIHLIMLSPLNVGEEMKQT